MKWHVIVFTNKKCKNKKRQRDQDGDVAQMLTVPVVCEETQHAELVGGVAV